MGPAALLVLCLVLGRPFKNQVLIVTHILTTWRTISVVHGQSTRGGVLCLDTSNQLEPIPISGLSFWKASLFAEDAMHHPNVSNDRPNPPLDCGTKYEAIRGTGILSRTELGWPETSACHPRKSKSTSPFSLGCKSPYLPRIAGFLIGRVSFGSALFH